MQGRIKHWTNFALWTVTLAMGLCFGNASRFYQIFALGIMVNQIYAFIY